MFAGTSSRSGTPTSGLLVTVSEAYDDNILADGGAGVQNSLQKSGVYTDLTANFSFHTAGRRLQFGSAAGTDVRYYSDQHTIVGVGHYGSSGLTYSTPRSTFSVDGGVAYAPSYLYRLFATVVANPSVGDTVASGYAVNDSSSYNYDARIGFTQNLSPRNRIRLSGEGRYTDFLHTTTQTNSFGSRDLTTYESGVTFSRGLTRDVNLNVGYTYRRAQYYTGAFPTEHDATFGLEYEHPLSKTRRTHLHVAVATAMLDAPVQGDATGEFRTQYRAIADASLRHQFARTWQVSSAYNRGLGFIEGFATPVATDGLSINTTGLVSRRVDLAASASYSVGEPVIVDQSSGFTTYAANVRMRIALNNQWALYTEYLYYYYDFSRGFVPIGLPSQMSRNSVRAGLTLWVPVGGR